jgi:hypothetical protein
MRKIAISLLTGLLSAFAFSRLAVRFFSDYLPLPWIWVLTSIIFFLLLLKPSKQWLTFAISFDLTLFGWQKLFHLQAHVPQSVLDLPFSSLPPDTVNWAYFQSSYPYLVTIGLTQIGCSFLLFFKPTRLAGLIMLIPVLLNIMMIDIFYQIGTGALMHAIILFAGVIYLLAEYFDQLKELLSKSSSTNIHWGFPITAALIPFLIVLTSPSPDKHPSITGKYTSSSTTIYLEQNNDVTLQWNNTSQRYTGKYQYQGDTLIAGPLKGIIKKESNHLTFTGTLNNDSVHLDMIRQ